MSTLVERTNMTAVMNKAHGTSASGFVIKAVAEYVDFSGDVNKT